MKAVLKRDRIINEEFSSIVKRVTKAINDYGMVKKNDKILVAVSGGKDSLSMMHCLDYLCKNRIFEFDMLVCNVDLGYGCANRKVLAEHFESYHINYIFLDRDILQDKTRQDIDCFWCSWNRRKTLFEAAKQYGCNKVSLGHHVDDIVHTALMNLFFYGEISTSAPYLTLFEGDIVLIRPLCYIAEAETEELAKALALPLPCCVCPQKPKSKRTFVKNVFASLFQNYPLTKNNIFMALRRLRSN